MEPKQYEYRTRLTPGGRHIIEVVYDGHVVATGKHAHSCAEAAFTEVQEGLAKLSLRDVIQPNGKLLDLIP